jgi:hypothetical protein
VILKGGMADRVQVSSPFVGSPQVNQKALRGTSPKTDAPLINCVFSSYVGSWLLAQSVLVSVSGWVRQPKRTDGIVGQWGDIS